MIHLLLLLVCILSVEVFIALNFLSLLGSILTVTKKVVHIIPQKNISDHWKEKVIPTYALIIIKHCLQILLIVLLILSLFIVAVFFLNDLLAYTLSLIGIIESILFALGYTYFRKRLTK